MSRRVASTAPPGSVFGVVDPFAGSCNGLFSILRYLPGADGLGFEFEQAIFDMSKLTSRRAEPRAGRRSATTQSALSEQCKLPAAHRTTRSIAPTEAERLSALNEAGLASPHKAPVSEVIDDRARLPGHPDPQRPPNCTRS